MRADAAVKVAASLGVYSSDPVVLADGANMVVHLSPAPVVAKVAASTTAVRPAAAWLQRELELGGVRTGEVTQPGADHVQRLTGTGRSGRYTHGGHLRHRA
jgi:hypothetical protein